MLNPEGTRKWLIIYHATWRLNVMLTLRTTWWQTTVVLFVVPKGADPNPHPSISEAGIRPYWLTCIASFDAFNAFSWRKTNSTTLNRKKAVRYLKIHRLFLAESSTLFSWRHQRIPAPLADHPIPRSGRKIQQIPLKKVGTPTIPGILCWKIPYVCCLVYHSISWYINHIYSYLFPSLAILIQGSSRNHPEPPWWIHVLEPTFSGDIQNRRDKWNKQIRLTQLISPSLWLVYKPSTLWLKLFHVMSIPSWYVFLKKYPNMQDIPIQDV